MNTLIEPSAKRGRPTIEMMENSHPTHREEKHHDFPQLSESVSSDPVNYPELVSTPNSDWRPYQTPPLSDGGARVLSHISAFGLALFIFLALPITQLLSEKAAASSHILLDAAAMPPPPAPPPEPPPEEEEVAEEDVPEMEKELQPLDLSQLDVALNPGVGDALNMGSAILGFGVTPDTIAQMDIFELKDLDNDPQRMVAVAPIYPFQFKREGISGWVKLIIVINEKGRVIKADVESSSHREFEQPGIDAIMQWRFEPGTRNGKPVKVRRLQPISYTLR